MKILTPALSLACIFTPQMHVPTSLYQCPHTLAFGMQSGHHSARTKLRNKINEECYDKY